MVSRENIYWVFTLIMDSSDELVDKYFVRRCINYHGEPLLKCLEVNQLKGLESTYLRILDLKIFRQRIKAVKRYLSAGLKELHAFIAKNGNNLFQTKHNLKKEYGLSNQDNNDQQSHLDFKTRKKKSCVDVLYGRVTGYLINNWAWPWNRLVSPFTGFKNCSISIGD